MTDVTSADFRCYDTATDATATTLSVNAGQEIGFVVGDGGTIYHPGVVNIYMAEIPSGSDATTWAGDGAVWFKVYQITAETDGGSTITFPAQSKLAESLFDD